MNAKQEILFLDEILNQEKKKKSCVIVSIKNLTWQKMTMYYSSILKEEENENCFCCNIKNTKITKA